MSGEISRHDVTQLNEHGVPAAEVQRQWALLCEAPARVRLERAAVIGDGIVRIPAEEVELLRGLHRDAATAGRWTKFTPASGAASRMFRLATPEAQTEFCQNLQRFAFFEQIAIAAARCKIDWKQAVERNDFASISELLLGENGLNFANIAKGLTPFHQCESITRTAFEEHLHEAAVCFSNSRDECAAHFTVQSQHQAAFEALVNKVQQASTATKWSVDFSVQKPSTDTIGIDQNGDLLRRADGSLVLRPGGHGALMENLADLGGDCVFVKNIDNVRHPDQQQPSHEWIETLGGFLLQIEQQTHDLLKRLDANPTEAELTAIKASAETLFPAIASSPTEPASDPGEMLKRLLNRPLRICGMVVNEGEPGGGPYWVRHADETLSLQIVEAAEIDMHDAHVEIVNAATHFNPVFMALSLRDREGNAFDLKQSVDAKRAIITDKPVDGKVATVLEHPGLWNGAMANWNTIFVEVPIDVFSPVKSVLDLLRPVHQPA